MLGQHTATHCHHTANYPPPLFRPDRASDELIVQAVLLPKASIVHVCKKSRKGSREYYRGDPFVLSGEPLLQC